MVNTVCVKTVGTKEQRVPCKTEIGTGRIPLGSIVSAADLALFCLLI